jgi:enoyl-CoA hydratase
MYVERQDSGGIATLTLNRPDRLNALGRAVFEELRGHLDAIGLDVDGVGCVILRGAGRAFCAGADMKETHADPDEAVRYANETIDVFEALPQPTIAAVHGMCLTGAIELVLAADLVLAAESAAFMDTHNKWAMIPAWGAHERLPRRVGLLKAKEIVFAGQRYSAADALAMGLINRVVPDGELAKAAWDLASTIAGNDWYALRAQKRAFNRGYEMSLRDAIVSARANRPAPSPTRQQRVADAGRQPTSEGSR